MEAVTVDHVRGKHVHRDPLGAAEDAAVQLGARFRVDLLRVVQQGKRTDAVVAQPLVVEKDARDHERAGQWASPRLVSARHEAGAEAPVEREQPRAGSLRGHPASIAPPPARAGAAPQTGTKTLRRGPG